MPPELINLWVVCKNPRDFPGQYTARRQEISKAGIRPTEDLFVGFTLESVRESLRSRAEQMGYGRLDRMEPGEGEDPVIVEVWL